MAISGVETKCYILALFVRDDNERFLLGSGFYEFKDNQKHFQANSLANDVVEVQGNDGYLLAGQVRRPGTQSFDGYIGDGTVDKTTTEDKRRDFFAFFRKNHFYKVIYVFSDGSAIQRKRGFLVDDPTVEELYQQYPEYHVALNFEDVNYYTYSEDGSGEEIYAQEADILLTQAAAIGGLVWDELGVVWEATQWGGAATLVPTAEGTVQNELNIPAPIDNVRIKGDTFQQSYSGKNLFDNTSTPAYTNVAVSTMPLSSGIRITATNVTTTTGTVAPTFPIKINGELVDLLNYVGSTIRIKSNFVASASNNGSISIIRGNTTFRTRVAGGGTNDSGREVSWVVPSADTMGDNHYLGLRLNVNVTGTVATGDYVDYTDLILTIDNDDMSYEPYVGGIPAPNPDYPQEVQTVTGEQTVAIGTSQSYTIDLGSTELCKIGDYQDYIYKNGDGWFVHKEVGNVILNGTESWSLTSNYTNNTRFTCNNIFTSSINDSVISDYFTQGVGGSDTTNIAINGSNRKIMITIPNTIADTLPELTTWLSNHNTTINYILATPTDTQITDEALIAGLNGLGAMKLLVGENNLTVEASGTNLPALVGFDYFTEVANSGAVWEEGGNGGPTMVEINSIDNVYPIWEVTGPAVNPQLSVLTTNTTISYAGTVAAGQKLVVDMFSKTAKLNGTSVIGNISGEWVNFAPGTNRVTYTTNNADAVASRIYWQEVVG